MKYQNKSSRFSALLLLPIVGFLLFLTGCSVADKHSSVEPVVPKTAVIFDTDMAIDDWAAMLFLLGYDDVDVLAITISASGETHCEPGLKNALALLKLRSGEESSIPVACGDEWPLDGFFEFPVAWQEDVDRLYNVTIPESTREPYSGHAAELIHESIQQSTEPVVILATGPMTNLAQWLEKYPEDKAKVSRVVLMGGNLDEPGNIIVPGFTDNNPNKKAEWNFYVDAISADIVLRSGLPVELVGLDVTNQVRVTDEFAKRFKEEVDNPAAEFWDQILDANEGFIASNEYYFWDVLAAVVVVDRERFCKGEMMALGSMYSETDTPWEPTSNMNMPTTNWQGASRKHLEAESAGVVEVLSSGAKNVLVCQQTDSAGTFSLFTDILTDEG